MVDQASNMLIFQVDADEYSQIGALLQTLDRPAKAALIEVTVAELALTENGQLGVEWLATKALQRGPNHWRYGGRTLDGAGGATFRVLDTVGAVRATLNALASTNQATILSSPRVQARNGETATIQVGQEVPIITSQLNTGQLANTSAVSNQVLQTVQYRTTGVILKVKPVIPRETRSISR